MCYPFGMIGRLRGELIEMDGVVVTVDCGGVGYEVSVPESVLHQMPAVGHQVDLRIRQVFREDGTYLYGFIDLFQRRIFDLLTEVKGCGPKIGLAILGQMQAGEIVGAILASDVKALSRANGVGSRLGERIVLELKDKAVELATSQKISAVIESSSRNLLTVDDELVDALIALGYRRVDAELAAKNANGAEIEERLKDALRGLAR